MSKVNVHKATIRKFNIPSLRKPDVQRECCSDPWLVLADPSDNTSWKNDRSLVFERCDTLTVTTKHNGGAEVAALGSVVNFPNEDDVLGFVINWRQYYDGSNQLIQGQYEVFVETTYAGVTEKYLWNTFRLLKYNDFNADGTVRIFSYFNHYSEEYDIDFSGSGALDTVRFRGLFGNRQPNYETKNNTETSKNREKVFNKSNNVYGLIVEPTVECKTLRIEELHLLNGSVMYISDHNSWNHNIANEYYKDKPVILSNDESPEFDYFEGIGTKYAKLLAKFKDKISKRKSRNTGTGENVPIPDIGLWNGIVCPTGGGDCNPATYQLTLDGEPLAGGSGLIASGASANIPIDAYIEVCPSPSGIAYFEPNDNSAAPPSFADYDDGWRQTNGIFKRNRPTYPLYYQCLDLSAANPYNTLMFNNIHGNTERFTFLNGTTYTPTVNVPFQDHLTGREWIIRAGSSSVWTALLSANVADGYYLPSDKEVATLKIQSSQILQANGNLHAAGQGQATGTTALNNTAQFLVITTNTNNLNLLSADKATPRITTMYVKLM